MKKLCGSLFFLVCASAGAAVSIEDSIPGLFDKSDLVCRGVVATETEANSIALDSRGKLSPVDYRAVIDVTGCYKGTVAGSTISLWLPSIDPMRGAPLPLGPTLLLFVKVRAPDTYVLTDANYVLWFLDMPPSEQGGARGIAQIESDLLQISTGIDPASSDRAMEALLRFPNLSGKSLLKLKSMSFDSDPSQELLRLVLLAKSDTSANLPDLILAVKNWDPGKPLPELVEIGQILAERSSSGDIESLEQMSNSRFPHLRMTAILGLRRIKVPSTIPFLIKQLDSTDSHVQYEAVITLAEMNGLGGDFGPSLPVFEQNPDKHKQLWKHWWTEHSHGGQ